MSVAAVAWLAKLGGFVSEAHAQSPPELSILSPAPDGWSRLRLAGATNEIWNIWKIDASEDLVDWKPIAILHASRFEWFWTDPFILNYQDPAAPDYRRRYYRVSVGGAEGSEWKNQVYFPADLYVAGGQFGEAGIRWIKFAILTDDPFRVYYQEFLLQAASESGRSTVWAFPVDPDLDDALRGELLELRTVPLPTGTFGFAVRRTWRTARLSPEPGSMTVSADVCGMIWTVTPWGRAIVI